MDTSSQVDGVPDGAHDGAPDGGPAPSAAASWPAPAPATPVDATPDPLDGDPRVAAYLGSAFPAVDGFAALLREQGPLRGLIGPRELPRLWERHLLNSGALAQLLPATGRVVDVGSGAGLPGVVLAAMVPGVEVVLIEPMERRTTWLTEVAEALGLENLVVLRGRAEEFHGDLDADVVTARAVAPLDKLGRWCLPLVRRGGCLLAMKGRSAAEELAGATYALRKLGGDAGEVLSVGSIDGVDATTVVRIMRQTVR